MKKLISLLISLGLLAILYWKIDLASLRAVFAHCDALWMTLSLAMVVPLTLLTAARLRQLLPSKSSSFSSSDRREKDEDEEIEKENCRMSFGEANRLILVASVLNLVLPSKGGDLAKAWFMKDRSGLSGTLALSLVVFEKACDMLSLLLWCVFGLALYPRKDALFWTMTAAVTAMLILGLLLLGSLPYARFFFGLGERCAPGKMRVKFAKLGGAWSEMHAYFWASRARLAKVAGTSVFLWFLHLLQIWMFILALRASAPFLASLALSPLAILAGLLPLTFAGVGTRDAALVLFYAPYFPASTAAALGLLCTARYLLPALGGLPFAGRYLSASRAAA